jgi:hypothetical protein
MQRRALTRVDRFLVLATCNALLDIGDIAPRRCRSLLTRAPSFGAVFKF